MGERGMQNSQQCDTTVKVKGLAISSGHSTRALHGQRVHRLLGLLKQRIRDRLTRPVGIRLPGRSRMADVNATRQLQLTANQTTTLTLQQVDAPRLVDWGHTSHGPGSVVRHQRQAHWHFARRTSTGVAAFGLDQ